MRSRVVLAVQEELDAQLVVLVKRRTSPFADFILGSTERRLLSRLPCDVLLLPERSAPTRARLPDRGRDALAAGAMHA